MNRYEVLGDYYQLLLKEGLLPEGSVCAADVNREVRLVSCDSQRVVPGTLFIVKGAHFKEKYLLDAAEKGAFVYVAEKPFENVPIPCIEVTHVRRAMALFAAFAIVLGIAMAVDFNRAFILFHHLLFTNDLWLLNPMTDVLIQMFPEVFFSDMATAILVWACIAVAAPAVISAVYLICQKRRERSHEL